MEGCCNMNMISSRTPQSGLGQLDVIGGIFSFATGLFSKDPQKEEYDRIRQQVWDSIVELVGEHDNLKGSGTLSRSILNNLIETMNQLLKGFKQYTDGMLSKYPNDSGWISPRFHDYYDFGISVRNGWQQELSLLPADYFGAATDYVQDFFGGNDIDYRLPSFPSTIPISAPDRAPIVEAGMSTTTMLLLGGVVVGLIVMSKRR